MTENLKKFVKFFGIQVARLLSPASGRATVPMPARSPTLRRAASARSHRPRARPCVPCRRAQEAGAPAPAHPRRRARARPCIPRRRTTARPRRHACAHSNLRRPASPMPKCMGCALCVVHPAVALTGPCLVLIFFCKTATVALSFVCDKYCPIID